MEAGDQLKIKTLPIPTEQRVDVFLVTPSQVIEDAWTRYGGVSRFHYPEESDAAAFCGVALFRLYFPPSISVSHFALLKPFFDRAGSEANVFEFDTVRRIFVRRALDWFDGRVAQAFTGCGYVSPMPFLDCWVLGQAGPTGAVGPS